MRHCELRSRSQQSPARTPREALDHVEDTKATSLGQLIGYKVNRPALVDIIRSKHRYPRQRDLLALLGAQLKSFLAIDLVGSLGVLDLAFDHEHVQLGRATVLWILLGQALQSGPQASIGTALQRPSGGRPGKHGESAGATLTEATALQLVNGLALLRGRYPFHSTSSFKATLSSLASPRIRLSLLFSASSSRRRFVSDTYMPPDLVFRR